MTTIRCSTLARVMECAGYIHLDVPDTEGGFPAQEGTAFGEYCQALLEQRTPPVKASNGIYIDADMKFYGNPLCADILGRARSQVTCETRIDWGTQSGFIIRGQPDMTFIDERGYLCIEDFKYGWGIVEVKKNWQLLGYAIGEVIRLNRGFTHISLTIHQPRPHHEDGSSRTWIITYQELLQYKQMIEDRMMQLADGFKDFQTGDKCKYCKGAAEACPAFSKLFYRGLEVSHSFVQDSLTNEEIARQLDHIKRAEEVLKIKLDSLVELGNTRIKQGGIIPGYVTVNKVGHRSWKQGVSPDAVKMLTGKNIIEESVMSPAKAEKLGVSKKLLDQLCHTPFTGVRLEKKNSSDIGNKIFGTQNPTGGN